MIRNLAGQRFGQLSVIRRAGSLCGGKVLWACRCDCGSFIRMTEIRLVRGNTLSCGCQKDIPEVLDPLWEEWFDDIGHLEPSIPKSIETLGRTQEQEKWISKNL